MLASRKAADLLILVRIGSADALPSGSPGRSQALPGPSTRPENSQTSGTYQPAVLMTDGRVRIIDESSWYNRVPPQDRMSTMRKKPVVSSDRRPFCGFFACGKPPKVQSPPPVQGPPSPTYSYSSSYLAPQRAGLARDSPGRGSVPNSDEWEPVPSAAYHDSGSPRSEPSVTSSPRSAPPEFSNFK